MDRSSDQKKFGIYSEYFNRSQGDRLVIPHSLDFDFGTGGDWTIDFWARLVNASGPDHGVIGIYVGNNNFFHCII